MTSTIGSYRLEPEMSSYCVAKTALNRLTEFIAAEAREQDVQVIAYHPGGVADTELTAGAPEWMQALFTETPALAAGTALWLSGEQAKWLSGRYVDARWDMKELEGWKEVIVELDLLKAALEREVVGGGYEFQGDSGAEKRGWRLLHSSWGNAVVGKVRQTARFPRRDG